jgi:hypothetical protein
MEQLDLGLETEIEPELLANEEKLRFQKAPGLSFTRLLSARIGGRPVKKQTWGSLLFQTIAAVKAKGLSDDRLVNELQVPARTGRHDKDGYKYSSSLGISVQGQSAQDCWKEVDRLANKWMIPVEIEFQWRENEKAQHPGRIGVLSSGSK